MSTSLFEASAEERVKAIKAGLPYRVFEELRASLNLPAASLGQIIQVPARTLQRRKQEGRFSVEESDRLMRIMRLLERAREALGEDSTAWLTSSKRFLSGRTPLEFADTETGSWEVMQALGRLEHGVFL